MKAAGVLLLVVMLLQAKTTTAQRNILPDSVNVVIKLHTRYPNNPRVDSVLVIFDRFDHTGAGIIRKIFYPVNNQVSIPQVPEGRYYISIYCMGAHQEYFSDLTFINKRHSNSLKYKLDKIEEFKAGTFSPVVEIDFSNMAITNMKSFQ